MTQAEQWHLQINQAASGLREIFEEQVRATAAWKRNNDTLQRRIDTLEGKLEEAHNNPQSTYSNAVETQRQRAVRAETLVGELQAQVRRQAEFMRLKDVAKMKVERDRDLYLRQRNRAEDRITALHDKAAENAELKALNDRQAKAFKDMEGKYLILQRQLKEVQGKLNNVLEMIQHGKRPPENPYGEWDPNAW